MIKPLGILKKMKSARNIAVVDGKRGIALLLFFSLFAHLPVFSVAQPIGYMNLGEWYNGTSDTRGNATTYLLNITSSFQQVTVYVVGPPFSQPDYVVSVFVTPYPSRYPLLVGAGSEGLDVVSNNMACPGDVLRGTYMVQISSNLAGSPYRFQITDRGRFYVVLL